MRKLKLIEHVSLDGVIQNTKDVAVRHHPQNVQAGGPLENGLTRRVRHEEPALTVVTMHRRTFLTLSTGALAACASQPSKPTRQTVELRSIGLLPIAERPAKGEVGPFNLALMPGAPNTYVPSVVTPSTLPFALSQTIRAAVDSSEAALRLSIAQALLPVAFSPRDELSAAIDAAFAKRRLPVEKIVDEAAANFARKNDDFGQFSSQMDAILDIQIPSAGYFPAKRAGGFSPTIYVKTWLYAAVAGDVVLEKFSYEADFRDADEGEVRFFKTPRALSVTRLDDLNERASIIRDGMKVVVALIANQIANDLERTVQKLPRIE